MAIGISRSTRDYIEDYDLVENTLRQLLAELGSTLTKKRVRPVELGKRGHWRWHTFWAIKTLYSEEYQLAQSFRLWCAQREAKSHPGLCVKCHNIMVDVDKKAQNAKLLWTNFVGNQEQRASVEKAYLRDLVNMHAPVIRALKELQQNAQASGATLVRQLDEHILTMEKALKECEWLFTVFVSYAHKDGRYVREELLETLKQYGVRFWWDNMRTGKGWNKVIIDALDRYDIGLCVVSRAFLESDYITKVEIRTLLERRETEGAVIIPVIRSRVDVGDFGWLKETQFAPSNGSLKQMRLKGRENFYKTKLVPDIEGWLRDLSEPRSGI